MVVDQDVQDRSVGFQFHGELDVVSVVQVADEVFGRSICPDCKCIVHISVLII
jgi:hypothetical protein